MKNFTSYKKLTNKKIELKLKGWEIIPTSITEDDCFIIFWVEKCIGKYWDKDPFGNAIPRTTRDRYIRKEVCYDKYADIIEEARI